MSRNVKKVQDMSRKNKKFQQGPENSRACPARGRFKLLGNSLGSTLGHAEDVDGHVGSLLALLGPNTGAKLGNTKDEISVLQEVIRN